MQLIVRSVFAATAGHGGNRRSAQIEELLLRLGEPVDARVDRFAGTRAENLKNITRGLFARAGWLGKGRVQRLLRPRALRNFGIALTSLGSVKVDPGVMLILDSYLGGYDAAIRGARSSGAKLVLFPHNLDSLVPGMSSPTTSKPAPAWLMEEIATLRAADLVCCISREEQWLLAAFGIPALFLPYFPPAPIHEGLAALRAARQASSKDKVVIIGSADNPPTLVGMRALVDAADSIAAAAGARQILMMGRGTDSLANRRLPSNFRVLGQVSDEVLTDALVTADVCLCYQLAAGGALTRIAEMLCAGVPVIANHVAARSYHNLPGIEVIESIDQMAAALRRHSPADFDPPAAPRELEEQLLASLKRLYEHE